MLKDVAANTHDKDDVESVAIQAGESKVVMFPLRTDYYLLVVTDRFKPFGHVIFESKGCKRDRRRWGVRGNFWHDEFALIFVYILSFRNLPNLSFPRSFERESSSVFLKQKDSGFPIKTSGMTKKFLSFPRSSVEQRPPGSQRGCHGPIMAVRYRSMTFKADEPFIFYSSLRLVELTGVRAATLPELAGQIRAVDDSSIYYHAPFRASTSILLPNRRTISLTGFQ